MVDAVVLVLAVVDEPVETCAVPAVLEVPVVVGLVV